MTDTTVITAKNLSRHYGSHMVVDRIAFSIPRGHCFGFLGPNGAGKTTSLRMILGLTPMSDGTLTVFGDSVATHASAIRARIGVVPQTDNLDPDFTVAENLRIYASYFGLSGARLDQRIEQLLEFAALTERRNDLTETLSGGMKRRLTIARALINNPELVILDEPTTGLDPQARHVVWSRLNDLRNQGITLLLTTHYMEEAERLCDELIIMDHGRILDQGSPRALIERHVEPEVVEIQNAPADTQQRLAERIDCRTEQHGTSLYCYTQDATTLLDIIRNSQGLTFLHRPAGLEDVFLKLTGRELRD